MLPACNYDGGRVTDMKKGYKESGRIADESKTPSQARVKESASVSISCSPKPGKEEGKLILQISVQNNGEVAFAWDREFSLLMKLMITAENGDPVGAESAEQNETKVAFATDRIVELRPGQVLVKEIDLLGDILQFAHARGAFAAGGESHVIPVASENMIRFAIHKELKKIRVKVQYEGGNSDALDGVYVYTGSRPEQLGLPSVNCVSATTDLSVDDL
jgi:hypothetical protein